MHLSIVIPTFNRARLLPRTLPALLEQRTAADVSYEIIFVSNGSSDESSAILKKVAEENAEKVRFFYIDPTGGPAAPRNRGLREATGDAVIILDDDVLPDADLVQRYAEFHQAHPEPHHAALGEAYVPEALLAHPMSMFHTFPYDEVRGLDRLGYEHFWTCNVSVKREFMLECGMFDEDFLYYEDILCGHRLTRNGMHLHFLPAARGQHLHELEPSAIPRKGHLTGFWLYPFVERIPETKVKKRFGILSPDIGAGLLAKRWLRRLGFRIVDNPLTHALLKGLGAGGSRRTRLSDFYYFLIFRRHLLAGYADAKRRAVVARRAGVEPRWKDRAL